MVRVLGLRYLALAGGLEGNVTLWRKNLIVDKLQRSELLLVRDFEIAKLELVVLTMKRDNELSVIKIDEQYSGS